MLPASRIAAVALSKNLAANCARTTSVAFVHIDKTIKDIKENLGDKVYNAKESVKETKTMGEKMGDLKDKGGCEKAYDAKEYMMGR
ncbi:unnamed protein product, partial [Mesorhabditis spiculigera]